MTECMTYIKMASNSYTIKKQTFLLDLYRIEIRQSDYLTDFAGYFPCHWLLEHFDAHSKRFSQKYRMLMAGTQIQMMF